MDFVKALTETLRYSVIWLKKPFPTAYYTAVAAVLVGITVIGIGVVLFFASILANIYAGAPTQIAVETAKAISLGSLGLIAFLVFSFIGGILLSAANVFIYSDALARQKIKVRPMNWRDFVKFFFLQIYVSIAALFSLYWPYPLFAVLGLGLLTYITWISVQWIAVVPGFLLVLSVLFYFANIVYQSMRLVFTPFYFITETNSITNAASKSLDLTKGKTIKIFGLIFLSSLIITTLIQVGIEVIKYPLGFLILVFPPAALLALLLLAAIALVTIFAVGFALSKTFYLFNKKLV
ncbi:MAG: hypothetical protein ABH803_02700 [Candidatus Micrarchaeota archaeon]